MPENHDLYNEAMNAGHEAAWSHDWVAAANAYGKALQEFPDDAEAHLNLAFALFRADRLEESLRVYSRAHQLVPDDPIALEKSADVLEKMGRLQEAAEQYANVAEVYLKQRDIDKAIYNWERATELTPGLLALHDRLAKAYRRIGDRKRAVYHYLTLAFNFNRNSDNQLALKAVQQALKLDRRNSEALNALRAVEAGGEVKMPKPVVDAGEDEKKNETGNVPSLFFQDGDTFEESDEEPDPLGPMGKAMTDALSTLANHVIETGGFEAGGIEALQAMELQRQGLHSESIAAYEQAARSIRHPSLSMNLGALLLLGERADDAIQPLRRAAEDPSMVEGATHALGQAYYNQKKYKHAAGMLLQVAQTVDLSNVPNAAEQQQIGAMYDQVIQEVNQRNDSDNTLGSVSKNLIDLLSGKEWSRRVQDNRHQMMEAMREGGVLRVLELLAQDTTEGIPEAIARIDRYMRKGLYTLAIDEAHYAVEKAPTYLPIHVRMAEIMMHEGRVRQAINKYNAVAKTYMVRGENGRAASILSEVLEMAPLDVAVRRNLIQLLEGEERWDEVLEQFIELADTYRQLGNLDTARDTFMEAERIAERVDALLDTRVRIKHEMADIDQLRLDMRRAQRVYEEVLQIAPKDERARRMLVDIYFNFGNKIEAIKQLDSLLRIYAQRKLVKNIVKVLQELVRSYPDDSGLRSRLAAIYQQLQRKEDAIEQYDRLAELQVEAGLTQDACDTINKIIKLGPKNLSYYETALSELNC